MESNLGLFSNVQIDTDTIKEVGLLTTYDSSSLLYGYTPIIGDVIVDDDTDTYSTNPADLSAVDTLSNGVLTAGTDWTATNEATLAGNKCTFAFVAGGASTLTQAEADLAVVAVPNGWYKLSYTIANKAGAPTMSLTTAFASATTSLPIVDGVNTVYFKAKALPTDFVITSTLAAGQGFDIDAITLFPIATRGTKYRKYDASVAMTHQFIKGIVFEYDATLSQMTIMKTGVCVGSRLGITAYAANKRTATLECRKRGLFI